MATKQRPTFLSVVFTTVVAPIAVSLAVKKLDEEGKVGQETTGPSQRTATPADPTINVTAEGTGHTQEEAVQHALRTALHNALSSTVPPDASDRQLVIDAALRDSRGLILSYQDVRCSEGRKGFRKIYQRTLTVCLSRPALAERVATVSASLHSRAGLPY